jgi:AraC-like DNA-binding protein
MVIVRRTFLYTVSAKKYRVSDIWSVGMIYTRCPLRLNGNYHEDVKAVSPDFPAEGYDELLSQEPGCDVPWHWHEELEAVVVSEGAVRLLAPGCSLLLEEGEGAFVNRDVMHAYKGEPTCRMRSVTFEANLVGGGQTLAITRRYLAPIVGNEVHPVVLLSPDTPVGRDGCLRIEEAVRAFESEGPGFEIDVRFALSHLMLDVLEAAGEDPRGDRPRAAEFRVREMCQFIETHLADDMRVSDIAAAASIGEREALRCFRQELATTPTTYLVERRMEHAARILSESPQETISQVAQRVGMKSASNFSQRFRMYFGCTPREWRSRVSGNMSA